MFKRLLIFVMLSNIFGCLQKKEDSAFKVFNEGVSLSLDAVKMDQNGQHDKASVLNKQAVDKFKETLSIDSTHFGARGALGHSFYLLSTRYKIIYVMMTNFAPCHELIHLY